MYTYMSDPHSPCRMGRFFFVWVHRGPQTINASSDPKDGDSQNIHVNFLNISLGGGTVLIKNQWSNEDVNPFFSL